MKPDLTIDFVDFWPTLIKNDNYIYHLLSRVYNLEISSNPDVLFFSCYGKKHLQYQCLKIFYSAENRRPDFSGCDYALTFDFSNHKKHFRWPLYAHHIDYENAWKKLTTNRSKEECEIILLSKKKFCCMVVSNGNAKERIKFFNELSKYKTVDSGGKYLNNVGGPVADKMDFIKDYKFVFSFENEAYPGYTTEKILQPFVVNSIPIYWGNPKIDLDFNEGAFINANKLNQKQLIEQIVAIDKDKSLAIDILSKPIFNNNEIPTCAKEENVLEFLCNAIESRVTEKLVSQSFLQKHLHFYNLKFFNLKRKLKRIF